MADTSAKIKELLERRRKAKEAADAAAAGDAASKELPAETDSGGDKARVTGMGRAAFLASLKKKNEEKKVGESAPAPADSVPGAVGRNALLEKIRAKKAERERQEAAAKALESLKLQASTTSEETAGQSQEASSRDSSKAKLGPSKTDSGLATSNSRDVDSKSEANSASTGFGAGAIDLEKLKMLPTFPEKKRGVKGREINASANIIRLNIIKDMGVFEYHVKFDPPVDNIHDKKKMIRQLEETIGKTRSFDGAILCLPVVLPKRIYCLPAKSLSGDEVMVTIKVVKRKDLKDCEQLFNVLFRKILEHLKMVEIKRNHYDPTARMMVPAHRLEIWPGYVVRCQEMDGGLMLTCDTSHKVLRKETAYTMMQDVKRKGGNFKDNIEKALVGAVVMTEYNRANTYRIDDIDLNLSPLSTFTTYSGEEISYQSYYKKTYNIDIKDLQQPLLIHRQRRKEAGDLNTEKVIILVPELCRMTGLTDNMRADFRVMKDVATFTKVSPEQRQQALQKFLDNVHKNEESVKLLSDWGLELDKNPIRLKARTLDPEKLVVGKGIKFTVNSKADWGRDITNNTCLVPVALNCWHVVCCDKNKAVVEGFIKLVKTIAPKMGIQVKEPTLSILPNDRSETYVKDLKEKIISSLQMVVIVVPLQREDRYSAVKKLCNTDYPIPSQVICARTISDQKKVNSVVQKIVLQMNCKVGGQLWGCNIPVKKMMVVGIDIYHDPTRKLNSVLGAVGSMNSTMSSWHSFCKIQRPGQELVDVLTTCLANLVKQYKEVNNFYPDQVIMFRDGVGDGQIDVVSNHEVQQCEAMFKLSGLDPEFAFIIVQKRINRRFFNMEGNKALNPPPGSVLDHTVMKKTYYDFLLVSQHVSQGTVTPTHYIVVRDTTTFSPDILQKISYKLTHMYYNWPGTVRVPAPCQYAHKMAYQVGENTKVEPSPSLQDRLYFL